MVTIKKIISPPAHELLPRCMCKIKGFEKCLAQVLASGTRFEMEKKLEDEEEDVPPRKKAKLDKENSGKTPKRPKAK